MFPEVTLKNWLSGAKEQAEFDLTNSGLTRYDSHNYPNVIPPRLQELPDPPETSLKSLLAKEYNVSTDQVLVTCRCQHANFIATAAARNLFESNNRLGDTCRALVENPTYQPLQKTPTGFDIEIDKFNRNPDNDFNIKADLVNESILHDTGLIVITNKHNPSGQLTDFETLEELSKIAVEYDAYLLVDEVYAPFTLKTPNHTRTPFGGISAAGLPNTVITNSLTKFHGLYDISVGWLIGEPEFLKQASIIEHHTNAVARPTIQMGKQVLVNRNEFINESREMLESKFDLLNSFIQAREDLRGRAFQYNIVAFVKHDQLDGNTVAEAALKRGVALQPGRFFGMPDWFRIALGKDWNEVQTGLERVGDVLDESI